MDPVQCFSQVVNLRCIGLSHVQRISLVIPPALHLLAALYLATLSLRRTQIRNSLMFIEAFVFFGLCVGELVVHDAAAPPNQSTLGTYSTADRAIGALSAVPLIGYMTFLPIFIGAAVLPYLHRNWHAVSMYAIVLAGPVLLVLQELASLDNVVYKVATSGVISQDYANVSARHKSEAFANVALGILVAVQLVVCLLCLRLIAHINHIREMGGSIPGITVKSTVMFAAGTSIGALDAGFGLVPSPIFATILFRRIIEAISRLLVIASLVSQHFSQESDSGLPPSSMHAGIVNTPARDARTRGRLIRRSGLLGLIGNPRYSTFANLGGDNVAADLTDRRRQQRVTVSYDHIHPPVLDVRFSQLEFPQVERALAYAAAAALASSPPPLSRAMASPRGNGSDPSIHVVSRNISLRANASLYRHRPEYFYPQPMELAPFWQHDVVRPDSPVFGRGSTVDAVTAAPGNQLATASYARPTDAAKMRETSSSRSTDLSGQVRDSYSTSGILSQFPETPRTRTSSGPFVASRRDSRNRPNEQNNIPISLSAREHSLIVRSRLASAAGRNDPFVDFTPSEGNGRDSNASSARIMTVDSRARVIAVGQPSQLRRNDSQNSQSHRNSFLAFSDGAPSPFDPNGYGATDSPVPNTTADSLRVQSPPDADAASQNQPASTSSRRPDIRHQLVPTAELAPLDVFRERLAERRRERSGDSGSDSTEGGITLSFSSPSLSRPTEPRLRTVSASRSPGIGAAVEIINGGRVSSVPSLVMGPEDATTTSSHYPPTAHEQSHWSETNEETATAQIDDGHDDNFVLDPPTTGALSRVGSERTIPSPSTIPTEIYEAEQRGSVVYGVAR